MTLTLKLEHVYRNEYLLYIIICDERSTQSFTIKCEYDASNIMILDNDDHSTEWCEEEWNNMVHHDGMFTFLSDVYTGTSIQCRYALGQFTLEVATVCTGVKSTQIISCDVKREVLESFAEDVDRQICRHRLQEELDYIRNKLYGIDVLDGHCDLTDQDIENIRFVVGERDTLRAIRDHCHPPKGVKDEEISGREALTTPTHGGQPLPYWGMQNTSDYPQNEDEWCLKTENRSVRPKSSHPNGYFKEDPTSYEMQTD